MLAPCSTVVGLEEEAHHFLISNRHHGTRSSAPGLSHAWLHKLQGQRAEGKAPNLPAQEQFPASCFSVMSLRQLGALPGSLRSPICHPESLGVSGKAECTRLTVSSGPIAGSTCRTIVMCVSGSGCDSESSASSLSGCPDAFAHRAGRVKPRPE
jgi:hypothetical protein